MGDKTGIGWTDATWNPTTGCTRVSPGCTNCYAFALHNKRYRANIKKSLEWIAPLTLRSKQRDRSLTIAQVSRRSGIPDLPYPPQYDEPFSRVQLLPDRLDQPLRWRRPRRIFVDSMADLFHEDVPDEFIDRVFATMALAPQHTFQVLTKRPERMLGYLRTTGIEGRIARAAVKQATTRSADLAVADVVLWDGPRPANPVGLTPWPLPNVWLGVSAENQHWADIRIPPLLETPAAKYFVSLEPLLGPIDLRGEGWSYLPFSSLLPGGEQREPGLDWVIVGGESGPRGRPMDHSWVRAIREQCRAAGVAFYFKQSSGSRAGLPSGDRDLDGCKEFPNASM